VVAIAELTDEAPRIASRGAAHEAFSSLFALPFDTAVVRDYREPALVAEQAEGPAGAPALGTRRLVGLGVAGGGLALAVTGLVFAASAGAAGELPVTASQSEAQSANDRIARDNALAAVFLSTGVLAMAGGAALYLWPPARAANVSVTPAAGGGYVTAVGRF
jgi:hypothetical protein